jgi:hypothetical protein
LVRPTYFGYTLQNFYQVIASPCGGGWEYFHSNPCES